MKKNLISEVERHPDMEVADLYKFIHQASFGSEHAVKDTAAVRNWLGSEISSLEYGITESIVDTLSPEGNLVRVNLRPWLQEGRDIENLLHAFIETANSFHGTQADFNNYWQCARNLADAQYFQFSAKEMDRFFSEKRKQNFPAIHHSKKYEAVYKPAYRVVDLQYLNELK